MDNAPQLDDIYSRQDIADRYIDWLRHGKPELGWKGDPRLVLAFNNGIEQRWEVLIHSPVRNLPDRHEIVMAAPAGFELNESGVIALIQNLVLADTTIAGNSHSDIMDRIDRENAAIEKAKQEEAVGRTSEALSKFYHEAGKTLGVTKTFFPT